MNRSRLTWLLLALLMLLVVTPAAAQDAAFPVVIPHKFGETTITAEPERIVAIGYTEQDFVLAFGKVPLAVRYWYGDEADAIFPWAEDEAGGSVPEVLNMPYGNLNYEAILAFQPDLISAVTAGITEEEYELLSQIAPTIPQSGEFDDFGMPWQEITREVGAAVGQSEQAETLVADVEGQFAAAREQNPAFAGKTITVAYSYGAGSYGFYSPQDSRGRFFSDLGFVIPDEQTEIAGDSFYADIDKERIDLLDQDIIIFLGMQFVEGGQEAVETDPLLSHLNAIKDGRVVFVPADYDDALQFSTVLSLSYALEGILPELQKVFSSETAVQTTTECAEGLRAVEDSLGIAVCVPENPQRVVALMESDLDALLALGVDVIGTTNGRGQPTPPRYLGDQLTDIAVVGDFYSPNLEEVLNLKPDLIVFGGFDDADVLAQLNEIAPTFNSFQNGESWKSHLLRVGEVVNKSDAAQAFIASYDERVQAIKDKLGENAGAEFIVARWSAEGPQVMAPSTFSSGVLLDLGLTPPAEIPELQEGHPHSAPLSLEAVDILDVDWAFIGTLSGEGDAVVALDEAMTKPLFQSLKVVQNKQVVYVDGSLWTSIGGPLAAMQVLDNVEAAMASE